MKDNYDYSVSFTRVCAMFFIMICHLGNHFNLTIIGQFFNIGVPIFFLISGYLYGSKEIRSVKKWLLQRIVRLYVPLLLWGTIMTIAIVLRGEQIPSLKEYVFFLLNLHGLNFIFYRMKDLAMGPWFFTVIMVCYFMTALYFAVKKRIQNVDKILFYYGGILPLVLFVVLTYFGINLNGLLCYMIGFGLKKRGLLTEKRPKNIYIAGAVFLLTVSGWILSRRFIDGTILYDKILAPVAHIIIAAAFFIGVKWLFDTCPKVFSTITASKVFRWMDRLSIYVYICHDWFLNPLFVDVFAIGLPLISGGVLFFICAFATAFGLHLIGERVNDSLKNVIA